MQGSPFVRAMSIWMTSRTISPHLELYRNLIGSQSTFEHFI